MKGENVDVEEQATQFASVSSLLQNDDNKVTCEM